MNGLYSMLIAVSMYSRIPVPTVAWSRQRMGYVMCWFPIVGVIIGIALKIWIEVADYFKFGPEISGIVGLAIPVLVTGGIHMDGFLDTWDALSSCMDREKKLEILKDPHLGAFCVGERILRGQVQGDINLLAEELKNRRPDRIITADETGCGIVPMDPDMRRIREETGRLLCRVASQSDQVWRVVCGLGQRIK